MSSCDSYEDIGSREAITIGCDKVLLNTSVLEMWEMQAVVRARSTTLQVFQKLQFNRDLAFMSESKHIK